MEKVDPQLLVVVVAAARARLRRRPRRRHGRHARRVGRAVHAGAARAHAAGPPGRDGAGLRDSWRCVRVLFLRLVFRAPGHPSGCHQTGVEGR